MNDMNIGDGIEEEELKIKGRKRIKIRRKRIVDERLKERREDKGYKGTDRNWECEERLKISVVYKINFLGHL